MNYITYASSKEWKAAWAYFEEVIARINNPPRTYAEHFQFDPPATRLRSLPAWNAVHQRRANVTQPLMPAERPW